MNKEPINQLHKPWESAQFERDSEAFQRKAIRFLKIFAAGLCVGLAVITYCCNKFEWLG